MAEPKPTAADAYHVRDEVTGESQGPYGLDEAKLQALRSHRRTGHPLVIQSLDGRDPEIVVMNGDLQDQPSVRADPLRKVSLSSTDPVDSYQMSEALGIPLTELTELARARQIPFIRLSPDEGIRFRPRAVAEALDRPLLPAVTTRHDEPEKE